MRYAIALLSLAFVACGRQDNHAPGPTFDPKPNPVGGDEDLKAYLNRYYLDASRFESKHVYANIVKTMKFVDKFDKPNVVGRCWISTLSGRPVQDSGEIEILRHTWENFDEPSRMGLMYHELTHCAQGRDHDPENSKTIMAPAMLSSDTYEFYWYDLIKQLFTRPSAPSMSLTLDEEVVRKVFEMHLVDGKLVEVSR